MIRSMYSGVAGLKAHQLKMDVIGNNIANVNTYGFKAGRATFSDMFSQTLSGATQANVAGSRGGTDPRQVGLGTMNSTIDTIHTYGAFQSTDRTLDVCIIDEGFFPVTNGSDVWYTRAGNLYLDSYGFLVTASGQYVLGVMLVTENGDEFGKEELLEASVLEKYSYMADELDSKFKFNPYAMDMEEFKGTDFTADGYPYYTTTEDGEYSDPMLQETVGFLAVPTYFRQISIDENGIIKGLNEDGIAVELGIIMTATFMNPGGLTKVGDNLYMESSNSGLAGFGYPGIGPNGNLKIGGLEMSNVDLANEFTSMITTQRGYQSNSRVITVSDTLLEELINLKR